MKPNAEQLDALQKFANANGRSWKTELNTLWMNGAYNNAVLGGADPCYLQQVRNTLGPTWLMRFSLPKVKFDLFWSPEGRKIATVEATGMKAAKRLTPLPYRKFLGEVYAEEVK